MTISHIFYTDTSNLYAERSEIFLLNRGRLIQFKKYFILHILYTYKILTDAKEKNNKIITTLPFL